MELCKLQGLGIQDCPSCAGKMLRPFSPLSAPHPRKKEKLVNEQRSEIIWKNMGSHLLHLKGGMYSNLQHPEAMATSKAVLTLAPASGLPNDDLAPFWSVHGSSGTASGVWAQKHGDHRRPTGDCGQPLGPMVRSLPSCLRAVTAFAALCQVIEETKSPVFLAPPTEPCWIHKTLRTVQLAG